MSRIVDIEETLKEHTDYKYFSGYPEYDQGVETGVFHMVDELENLPIIDVDKIISDLKYYLDTNEENGVVYIPKFVIERIVYGTTKL